MPLSDDRLTAAVAGRRALLVASTGGHLAQLHRLAPSLGVAGDSTWVTFDHPQSRSLLAGQDVSYIPYIPPRGFREAASAIHEAVRLVRATNPQFVLSTGAAIAAPFLGVAAALGVPAHYLESVSRFEGPSLTGRILRRVPRITTYTQHHAWSDRAWHPGPNVMSQFKAVKGSAVSQRPLKVFVTLGTIKPYRFDRLVDTLARLGDETCDFAWQLGETTRAGLPGHSERLVGAEDFDRAIKDADVVVTHAGVGSAMRILELGKLPIMVPRDPQHGEHVDRHQFQVASFLAQRGLGLLRTADAIAVEDLREAARWRVTPSGRG